MLFISLYTKDLEMTTVASFYGGQLRLTVHRPQTIATGISTLTIAKIASSYLEHELALSLVNVSLVALTAVSCLYALKTSTIFTKTITKNSEVPILNIEEALKKQIN
jgi:ABC-type microcin C transport system permease subunit YejE